MREEWFTPSATKDQNQKRIRETEQELIKAMDRVNSIRRRLNHLRREFVKPYTMREYDEQQ